ncbi:MAG: hypothetical protein COA74_04290 [Gammaproteobacteria bacterium]|nr:MAG: hypothetical protein COA74_04290 [Gammaproteobacteria bacterium]
MYRLAIGCLCLILSNGLLADEMTVPIGQQGDMHKARPASGMTREVVEENFGAPESIKDAIGEPPITIWRYNSYSVYFEYNLVIHTVLHKADS